MAFIVRFRHSSSISKIRYDGRTQQLWVWFPKTHSIWVYREIPYEEVARLIRANSVGAAFNAHVRNRYPAERIHPIVNKLPE